MTPEKFDLVVIGSGPAGEKGAAQVAYFGKRVALVERSPHLGGAGANTGTLPSKTLRETALFYSSFKQRRLYGLNVTWKDQVTVPDFLAREHHVKDTERARILQNLKRHNIRLFTGCASFVDGHTIAVKPERCSEFHIQGDVILIATGSYPFRPPTFPFHDPRVYDSDTILTIQEIPPSMVVVGGGVIGCEYACMFAALGIQVSLVEKRDRLIGSLDLDVALALRTQMEAMGIRVFTSDSVSSVEPHLENIAVNLESGELLLTETILVSSGRSGNTADLALDKVGVKVNSRGQVLVNEQYQTAVPHIYAAGDVIGNPGLASTSMEQARVAMVHAFNLNYREGLPLILPSGIYTIPECSMAGETEDSLVAKKVPYVAGKAFYSSNARGQIIGDDHGFLKLLFAEDTMKLLGVHVIGEQATELVHVGLQALLANAGADLFIATCYNYPTLTELYKYATYDALGRRAARHRERTASPEPV
jgi:NAD(P) transhydrogenase